MGLRKDNADFIQHNLVQSNALAFFENKYGAEGYRFFWKVKEVLAGSDNFKMKHNDVSLVVLRAKCGCGAELFEQMFADAIRTEVDYLVIENGELRCPALEKELDWLVEKRQYMRKRYETQKTLQHSDTECTRNQEEKSHDGEILQDSGEKNTSEVKRSEVKRSEVNENLSPSKISPDQKTVLTQKWNSLNRSGLIGPALEIALKFADWDGALAADFKRSPPPADRILLVDVIQNIRNQLGAPATEMILSAKKNLEQSENMRKINQVNLYYLFNLRDNGSKALQTIRYWANPTKKETIVAIRTHGYGVSCNCGGEIAAFKFGDNGNARSVIRCSKCAQDYTTEQFKELRAAAGGVPSG